MSDSYGLEPSEYWRKPPDEIQPGDIFQDIPQLSLRPDAQALTEQDEDEGEDKEGDIYLPTERVELALLLKILRVTWWFVPVLTPASVGHRGLFDDMFEGAVWGRRPGWFPLPPLEPPLDTGYPPLADFSLVYTLRPTIHRPDVFHDAHEMRVASLTPIAYDRLCQTFMEGFLDA